MSKPLLVAVCWFNVIIFSTCTIKPNRNLEVVNGEGFVAYLDVSEGFGAIENCWFAGPISEPVEETRHYHNRYGYESGYYRDNSHDNRRYQGGQMQHLDLNSTIPIRTNTSELVLPFSSHKCGLRVHNLNDNSVGRWYLRATGVFGELEEDFVTIGISPYQKKNVETIASLEIGRNLISCSDVNSKTKRCKVISDQGEIWDQCEVTTIITQNRTFDCLTFNYGQIEPNREHIVVQIKNLSPMTTTARIEENEDNYILRCPFDTNVFSCQVEMPDHENGLLIMEGLYNGKYSSYDTSSGGSFCALEIPKPLAPNEIGVWRIKKYDSDSISGCIFHIGGNKTEIIENELEKIQEPEMFVVHLKPWTTPYISEIACTFPFAIDGCYIRAPDNTVYFPDSLKFQRMRPFGNCSFTGLLAKEGTWVCGARGQDYPKEIVRDIEVIYKSYAREETTIQFDGKYVELMCNSRQEEQIANCAFVDPQDRVHLVATENSMKTEGRVQYNGRGLNMGECGVRIGELTAEDYGTWSCQFHKGGTLIVTDLKLKEQPPVEVSPDDTESSTLGNTPSP